MSHLMLIALVSILLISRADADDIASYAISAGQEVAATKRKLNSNDGIFIDVNFRGTHIRPARPEDRAPASAEIIEEENSPDSN